MAHAPAPEASHDPRWQRSRERLHSAAIELARTRPAASITGAALADAAGVHRSTVYQHGTDPLDIVRSALRAELDEIRQRVLEPATAETIVRAVGESAADVFAHVDRHALIYARDLTGTPTAGLAAMLAEHFAQSITMLIEHEAITPPAIDDDSGRFGDTVAAALAATAVAVIEVWLRDPEPRDRDLLARRWSAVLPPWWPHPA